MAVGCEIISELAILDDLATGYFGRADKIPRKGHPGARQVAGQTKRKEIEWAYPVSYSLGEFGHSVVDPAVIRR